MRAAVACEMVDVPAGGVTLEGDLTVPDAPRGVVLFAHGSGSSRFSSRNRHVASELSSAGFATLLMDLLTRDEEAVDHFTTHLRFDIPLLAARLAETVGWLGTHPATRGLRVGLFGASTGGGAALMTAASLPDRVAAVVSRGGRPDLAAGALPRVQAPTLLIVGGKDAPVIELNRDARRRMDPALEVRLEVVPGASHLFEERGALEEVSRLATGWFREHL
jgi:putative phosphoribosyl transferase